MKKIAIFFMIAVLCLVVIATSCTDNGKTDSTEPTKATDVAESSSLEDEEAPTQSENASEGEVTTEEATTEEVTTKEILVYEPISEGNGIEMPEVPI